MTITIPAEDVLRLREALYMQLGDIAEDLASAARPPGREASDEWPKLVARFDRTRAVLDAIGWSERDPEADAALDLAVHRPTIVAALREDLETERDMMDTDNERQRERATTNAAAIERLLTELNREVK
jgi:hypothetical protein